MSLEAFNNFDECAAHLRETFGEKGRRFVEQWEQYRNAAGDLLLDDAFGMRVHPAKLWWNAKRLQLRNRELVNLWQNSYSELKAKSASEKIVSKIGQYANGAWKRLGRPDSEWETEPPEYAGRAEAILWRLMKIDPKVAQLGAQQVARVLRSAKICHLPPRCDGKKVRA